MNLTLYTLSPITADPCAEFFDVRSKVQKLRRQLKKKSDFFKRTIASDGFVSLDIEHGDRNIILAKSTRSDSDADWQGSDFYKDEATMHESFYDLGSDKEGYQMSFSDMIKNLVDNTWDGCRVTVMRKEAA